MQGLKESINTIRRPPHIKYCFEPHVQLKNKQKQKAKVKGESCYVDDNSMIRNEGYCIRYPNTDRHMRRKSGGVFRAVVLLRYSHMSENK